jgi:trimethylamine-N-oxide reductase (cytochrome c)
MMNRQVLRAILFALPKALSLTAARIPAYAERLMQRDVVAWIGLQDGSIGRILEIRGGKVRSRAGSAAQAEVTMTFKDAATALKLMLPNRDQGGDFDVCGVRSHSGIHSYFPPVLGQGPS